MKIFPLILKERKLGELPFLALLGPWWVGQDATKRVIVLDREQ